MTARVTAPSRLHFGLLRVPAADDPSPARAFGGVGLMVDLPGVAVTARPAGSWQVEGPLAARAQGFALRFAESLPEDDRRPCQLLVERSPPDHVGLGVGTQLGLAVGKALAVAGGFAGLSAVDLAARVGRGERSAVGVHGFDSGGLVVEGGKRPGEAVSPAVARLTLPADWRAVLFLPAGSGRWAGDAERAAFARSPATTPEATAELARLTLTEMLPAAAAGDLPGFGAAVYAFNRLAGEPFRAAQGGVYASPEVDALVADLRAAGVAGCGQSSWGPTAFALVGSPADGLALARRFAGRGRVVVTTISAGHSVTR